ncbi:hypothetical protein [Acidiphilium iwatense]|uniref:hypothetical protein n=1 Tax=Acidiphilium iwatense TaxID=768198 RepID=UPI001F226A76|nr:hypothetical protein [Acidiphilium iwatense]
MNSQTREVVPLWTDIPRGLFRVHYITVCHLFRTWIAASTLVNVWQRDCARAFRFFRREHGSTTFQRSADRVIAKICLILPFHKESRKLGVKPVPSKGYLALDGSSNQISSVLVRYQNSIDFLKRMSRKSNHGFVNESLGARHPLFIRARCPGVQAVHQKWLLGYLLLTYKISLF